MNNAERIRSMTDEELTEFLTFGGFGCSECKHNPASCTLDCKEGCLSWLKEKADDGAGAVEERIAQTFMGDSHA